MATGAVLSAGAIKAVNVVADQTAFWQTGQNETQLQVAIIAVPFAGADGPLVRAALTRAVYALALLWHILLSSVIFRIPESAFA
jgi:hypothetical protein